MPAALQRGWFPVPAVARRGDRFHLGADGQLTTALRQTSQIQLFAEPSEQAVA